MPGAAVSAGQNGVRHSVYASKNRWSSIDWNCCTTPARARYLKTLKRDIASVSPETEVVSVEIELHNPWDFEEVYACLHDFARGYEFQPEKEDYLIHITTGTHVAQICWFLLAEARYLPARLIQSSPPRKRTAARPV